MKQYSFSTEDLKFLTPLESLRIALENQIKTYIGGIVTPRVGVSKESKVNYDVLGGTFTVTEPEVPEVPVVEKTEAGEGIEEGKNESTSSPEKPE